MAKHTSYSSLFGNGGLDSVAAIEAKSFRARYPGRCGVCRERVLAGDDVVLGMWYDRRVLDPSDRNLRHTACAVTDLRGLV